MGSALRTGLTSAHLVQLAFPALQDLPLLAPPPERSFTELIVAPEVALTKLPATNGDRKSTRLNSSHLGMSYAVFCLKKKKNGTFTPAFLRALLLPLGLCMNSIMARGPAGLLGGAGFFFNDTATTEIYTLSLHDALPI